MSEFVETLQSGKSSVVIRRILSGGKPWFEKPSRYHFKHDKLSLCRYDHQ